MARRAAEKKRNGRPVMVLGYLTANPKSIAYNKLLDAGLIDPAPQDKDRYCLYHLFSGLVAKDFRVSS